jgi:zinc transport system substrate-binding protein
MRSKLLILIALIFTNNIAIAKPKIVTSITPIASIVAMLVQDQAELKTITATKGCPHHYHIKPSDLKIVEDADLVIYISDEFDGFTGKLMKSRSSNVVRIGDMKSIKIVDDNWHFWLDLDNVESLLTELSSILIQQFPSIQSIIDLNLDTAHKQIAKLKNLKNSKLTNLQNLVLVNDSLEYFFNSYGSKVRLYKSHHSPRYIANLEKILSKSRQNCLVISSEQQDALYRKFTVNIIKLDSENWTLNEPLETLFYNNYIKMIDEVAKCVSTNEPALSPARSM